MCKQWKKCQTLFSWAPKSLQMVTAAMKFKRCFLLGRKAMINLDSILKSRDITWPTKVHLVKAMVSPVVMYGCESWTIKKTAPKNQCFWTVVLEKNLASPLDCKEIQPAHPRGDQSCVFIERADAEAETPNTLTTWWEELIWKDPDAGKDWRQEEKRVTEHETVGWIEIWVSSGSWCWTGKPGVLQYMGSQSETWLNNWTERYAAYLFVLGTLSVLFPVP